jgi:hypothetical protein
MSSEAGDGTSAKQDESDSLVELLRITEAAKQFSADIIPALHDARRKYAKFRSVETEKALSEVQDEAERRREAFTQALRRLEAASGIPPEVLDEISKPRRTGDKYNRISRSQLTVQGVQATADIDSLLPNALEALLAKIPGDWLDQEPETMFRPIDLLQGGPMSIVKGIRPESEFTIGHRLRQAMRVSTDWLQGCPNYDHFAGSILVPQLTQLGSQLRTLETIPNSAPRIESLWQNPSEEVDSTIFELLVGAACAQRGRDVEFISATREKSPDIRVHDPFPLVIECKRRASLSNYERSEETVMRRIFQKLDGSARAKGITGRFELVLSAEADQVDEDDVVRRALLQRLAGAPERSLQYPWGSVAFSELPSRVDLAAPTRPYSPAMLDQVFGWNSDLPDWDGIICKVTPDNEEIVDQVRDPVGLFWSNISQPAIVKRTRTPVSLFSTAFGQIPGGEIGLIYVAYNEGAREEVADMRVTNYSQLLNNWEGKGLTWVPASFLLRLYPRALGDGAPDLIESTVRYLTESETDNRWIFEHFPSTVFSPVP